MLRIGSDDSSQALSVTRVREAMRGLSQALDPRELPEVSIEQRLLDGPGGALPVSLYAPLGAESTPVPGLVYFHGGAGVFGSAGTHDALCRMLCHDAAVRVVSVDYRLAPEHPFPAALEDCWFATGWVAEHAAELGIDGARLAVGGDSAGATLATVICQQALEPGSPRISAQVLLCPVTDLAARSPSRLEFAEGYLLSATLLEWATGLYCHNTVSRSDPRVSPLRANTFKGLPPALIHTAEFDPLRDEGAAYAVALERAGVAVQYTCHAGLIHHFYCMAGAVPAARAAITVVASALGAVLREPIA